jgi:hypothetical protein
MTDAVFALLVALSFLLVLAGARWFKTLDTGVWRAWRTALPGGIAAGVLLRFIGTNAVAAGIVLTVTALYVRLTGEESEPSDGMISGAAAGAMAAITLIVLGSGRVEGASVNGFELAECLLAGAAAGFGVTLAAIHAGRKLQQLVIDTVTAVAAITVAAVPLVVRDQLHGLDSRSAAIAAAVLIPLLVVVTLFQQWSDVKAELSHEASLGFIGDADVRPTAHPFARLARAGWSDPRAHRAFVRLATLLALRKRQQRNRSGDAARLYQLEIIKLRMQVQEMARIDHDVAIASAGPREPSDTIPTERHEA